MPAKPFDWAKPTFYLDHSTLCDAFKAHVIGQSADHAYLPLLPWIERVARDANLCLSETHLYELAGWGDQDTAMAMARWYEQLPVVWAVRPRRLLEAEQEYWLKVALGCPRQESLPPFVASIVGSLKMEDPHLAAVGLKRAGDGMLVPCVIRAMRDSMPLRDGLKRAVLDESAAARQYGNQLVAADPNRDARELSEIARAIDRRLLEKGDLDYVHRPDKRTAVEALLTLWNENPVALPAMRALARWHRGFLETALRRPRTSKKEERAAISSFYDSMHAICGAYCDVFTCDGRAADLLGDVRETIGRPRQLAVAEYGGDVDRFVGDLVSHWP